MSYQLQYLDTVDLEHLNKFKPFLAKESRQIIDFLSPSYSDLNQYAKIPLLMLGWTKDVSINYQNVLVKMNLEEYDISRSGEEIAVKKTRSQSRKRYHRQSQRDYVKNTSKGKMRVKEFKATDYQVFRGSKIPSDLQALFQKGGNPFNNKIKFIQDTTSHLVKALIAVWDNYQKAPNKEQTDLHQILEQIPKEKHQHIIAFLTKIKNKEVGFSQISNWINQEGRLVIRYMNIKLCDGQLDLPKELGKRMLKHPGIYNEFVPLMVQKYIEDNLNKRYHFKYHMTSSIQGNQPPVNIDLEIWDKSYFEPVQFPVTVEILPLVSKEYKKELKSGRLPRKNIIFILARLLLVQSLHLPWTIRKDMKVKMFLTSFTKQLPQTSDKELRANSSYHQEQLSLGANEINSGSNCDTDIHIWREEEFFKLMIHESVHHANIDFKNNLGLDPFIRENFNIDNSSEFRIYESYTETCALLINTFTSVYEILICQKQQSNQHLEVAKTPTGIPIKAKSKKSSKKSSKKKSKKRSRSIKRSGSKKRSNNEEKIEEFQTGGFLKSIDVIDKLNDMRSLVYILIRMEQLFTCFQVAKILVYFGFDSMKQFVTKDKNAPQLKQYTSIMSYFIIKGGFINNLDKLVNFFLMQNPNVNVEEPAMNLKFNIDKKHEFRNLIQDCVIDSHTYHQQVDYFIEKVKTMDLKKPCQVNEFNIEKTLRMTVTQLASDYIDKM